MLPFHFKFKAMNCVRVQVIIICCHLNYFHSPILLTCSAGALMYIIPTDSFCTEENPTKRLLKQTLTSVSKLMKELDMEKDDVVKMFQEGDFPAPISFDDVMKPRDGKGADRPPSKRKNPTKRKGKKRIKSTGPAHPVETPPPPPAVASYPNLQFPDSLAYNDVKFLAKMKETPSFYVCTKEKDGCLCGFGLCEECRARYQDSSSGRGARRRRVSGNESITVVNELTEEEKRLLTDCHKDVVELQARGKNYFGSAKTCINLISTYRVYNCAKCHKFHNTLEGKMEQIPELKTRFGLGSSADGEEAC